MARLPVPNNDEGMWGTLLNEFLRVAHRDDGILRGVIDVANIRDFGATGDGVADDTTAILNAIIDRLASGGIVYLPTGDYRVTFDFFHDEPISSKILFLFHPGARLVPDAGLTVRVYSPENIVASPRQQIHTGEGALAFHVGGTVYVPWWNANAGDSVTECSAAFQSAIASLPSGNGTTVCCSFPESALPVSGGTVIVPSGSYLVAESIRINQSGIVIEGVSNHSSIICYAGEGAALALGASSGTGPRNITVRRLKFTSDNTDRPEGSYGIDIRKMRYFIVEDCWFQGRDYAAIHAGYGSDGRISDVRIDAIDESEAQSDGCYQYGIQLERLDFSAPNQITIDQCYIEWTKFAAIQLKQAEKTMIRNCLIQSNHGHGICYDMCYSLTIHDCYFEDNGRSREADLADIYDMGTSLSQQVSISNNHFSGGAPHAEHFRIIRLFDTRGCVIKENRFRSGTPPDFYVGHDCFALNIHDNISRYDPVLDGITRPEQMRFKSNRLLGAAGVFPIGHRWTGFRDDDLVRQNASGDIIGYPATVTPDARRGRFVDYGVISGPVDIMPPLGLVDSDTIIIQWKQDARGGHEVRLDRVSGHYRYRHGTSVNSAAHRRNTYTFIYDAGADLLYELSASTEAT